MNIETRSNEDPVATAPAARSGTQSIERVVALLRQLAAASPGNGASAAHLAARTGLDRGTAHRMLQCLAREGLLGYDEQTRRYHFGPLAYEIGLAAAERMDLAQLCRPTVARIAEETGDTAFLMVRSGDDAVCADRAEGSYPIKTFVVDVGTRRPLGVGAGSLAMLSALPDELARQVLANNTDRLDAYGMNAAALRAMTERTHREGYVAMDVVGVPGARAVAMPVLAAEGRPVAALSVAAISARMGPARERELAALLGRKARELELALERRMARAGTKANTPLVTTR